MREWDKPLMDRKPKPVEKDEFDRMQKALRAERWGGERTSFMHAWAPHGWLTCLSVCVSAGPCSPNHRINKVKETSKEVSNYLKETNKILRVSNASADWRSYVDYVNNRVVTGLARVIMSSLEYFQNEIDPKVQTDHRQGGRQAGRHIDRRLASRHRSGGGGGDGVVDLAGCGVCMCVGDGQGGEAAAAGDQAEPRGAGGQVPARHLREQREGQQEGTERDHSASPRTWLGGRPI